MKSPQRFLLLWLALAATLFATALNYSPGPDTLWRVQADPVFADNGAATAFTVTAFYQATLTNDADATDRFTRQLGSVQIDCVRDAHKTVSFTTAEGETFTYTYAEIAGVLAAAAKQEWVAAQHR